MLSQREIRGKLYRAIIDLHQEGLETPDIIEGLWIFLTEWAHEQQDPCKAVMSFIDGYRHTFRGYKKNV